MNNPTVQLPPWEDSFWDDKVQALLNLAKECKICPHSCKSDRREKKGICQAPATPMISSANLHYGEEPPISGDRGSGTIFLTWCNLHCIFCQNYPISQQGVGESLTVGEMASKMLSLENRGAHNINFVSPTHYSHVIARSLLIARRKGLTIPIVWNSNGYERLDTLQLLEGFIDVYMPDLKYADDSVARKLSSAPRYWEVATTALKEMKRQVGQLVLDDEGIAVRGLLIRHLVLPELLSGTHDVLKFIAEEIGKDTFISLMSQYFPAYKAPDMDPMSRRITKAEYQKAIEWLEEFDLENGFAQE